MRTEKEMGTPTSRETGPCEAVAPRSPCAIVERILSDPTGVASYTASGREFECVAESHRDLLAALKEVMKELMVPGRVSNAASMRAFEAIGKATKAEGR